MLAAAYLEMSRADSAKKGTGMWCEEYK